MGGSRNLQASQEKMEQQIRLVDLHFFINKVISIYGGFAGTEQAVPQRSNYGNGEANETILSGDIQVAYTHTDNCYNIVVC